MVELCVYASHHRVFNMINMCSSASKCLGIIIPLVVAKSNSPSFFFYAVGLWPGGTKEGREMSVYTVTVSV